MIIGYDCFYCISDWIIPPFSFPLLSYKKRKKITPSMRISFCNSTVILLISSLKYIKAEAVAAGVPSAAPAEVKVAEVQNPLIKLRNEMVELQKLLENTKLTTDEEKKKDELKQIVEKNSKLAEYIATILKAKIFINASDKEMTVESIKNALLDAENKSFIENAAEKVNHAYTRGSELLKSLHEMLSKAYKSKDAADANLVATFENVDLFPESNARKLFENFKAEKFEYQDFLNVAGPLLSDLNRLKSKSEEIKKTLESKESSERWIVILYAVIDVAMFGGCVYLIVIIFKVRKERAEEPVINEVRPDQQYQ